MRRWRVGMFLWGCLMATAGVALADYRATTRKNGPPEQTDDFGQAVDLTRFRRGNIEWDTQELVSSGFMAVHRDHEEILQQIRRLDEQIQELKKQIGKRETSSPVSELKK